MGTVTPALTMAALIILLLAVAVSGDSEPYTIGQVLSGQTAGGVITGVDYGRGLVPGFPAVAHTGLTYTAGYPYTAYTLPYNSFGRRKREASPYTVGQIAHGAHIANAAADGRLHNVGVITNAGVYPYAHHTVAATPIGLTHSANVGVCTNYVGAVVPC